MRLLRGSIFGVAGLLLVTAPSARATQAPTGPSTTQRQTDQGQKNFQTLCSVCHTIGGGRLVGPDLQGVSERRSEAWIIRFVQHSQELVAAGDPDAVALFQEFNRIPMPDQPLSD
ncbi:MAG: cytochrome c [Gemmatimonadetes bacterium]|nr:cytochrome c [Gemmatimonadota bacterium]